ncbi:MAG TPA: cytidine deaminase [Anaerolineales bacterium]
MLTDELRQKLIETALVARQWAYAPYSQYHVGAALLTASDRIYDGVNVENAAYPSSMCAERVAVFKAISEGEKDFVALAVASSNGGAPCGACRQVLAEFGLDTLILIVNSKGEVVQDTPLASLLPSAFQPKDLAT